MHDQKLAKAPDKAPKHHIYSHEALDSPYDDGEHLMDPMYDIDCTVETIEINATNFDQGLKLPYAQWQKLPDDARKIWDMLSPEAKTIILQPKPAPNPSPNLCQRYLGPGNKLPPPHNINEHDITHLIACLHDLHGGSQPSPINDNQCFADAISAPEDTSEDQLLLAHMTKCKPLPPGHIKRLMSPAANNKNQNSSTSTSQEDTNKPREVNLNSVTYSEVSMAITYTVAA